MSEGMKADVCKACKKPIGWITTEKEKPMPVDLPGIKVLVPMYNNVTPDQQRYYVETGYMSHFATCPAADRFRKPRREQSPDG